MADEVRLVFGGPYDRITSLQACAREVGVEVRLDLLDSPKDAFAALAEDDSIGGGEMSVSFYMTMRSRQGPDCDLVALPVWVSRSFRHGNVFVAEESPLRSAAQLSGATIGLPEYSMTMAVWLRGLWGDEVGLRPEDIRWVTNRAPAALDASTQPRPSGVSIEAAEIDAPWPDQLRGGRIDAWIGAGAFPAPAGTRRLLDDPYAAERDYYHRTGVFPIMHVFVLKRSQLEARPELAELLFTAFERAKQRAEARLRSTSVSYLTLPWTLAAYEEQARAFGGDPWPYGLERNRPTLDALQRYMREQQLLWSDAPESTYFLPLEPRTPEGRA